VTQLTQITIDVENLRTLLAHATFAARFIRQHDVLATRPIVSPPVMLGTRSTGSNGAQGPTRWHANSPSPPPGVRSAGGVGVVVTPRFS
jgi:hypothetical protein